MANLAALLVELEAAARDNAIESMRTLRQTIVATHPDSEAAAEARYRLGLDALFFGRDIDRALELFEEAVKSKHPAWAPAARTSMGVCLLHLGRTQKGMFELRKVAFVKEPTMHSATALTLMESFCLQQQLHDELPRVRKERMAQLERLSGEQTPPKERGQYQVQLGYAYLDAGDKKKGREWLLRAQALGPEVLGADVSATILSGLA